MVIKPVPLAAVLTAILIYTGLVPVYRTGSFSSLIEPEQIETVQGVVTSSPVRTGSGNSYRVTVCAATVQGISSQGGELASSATGSMTLFIDAPLVEALYPGRLYSRLAGRNAQLVEEGACITARVRYSGSENADCFYCNTLTVTGYTSRVALIRALARLEFKRLLYAWGDAGGLLLALLSGEREYTDSALSEAFRFAGLSHILALSGMHLSLFAGLAGKLTRGRFGVRGAAISGLCAAAGFVWFAGATPSLVRALICMIVGILCGCLQVKGGGIGTLALSFLIQTALFPRQTDDVAFILSYLALAGVFIGSRFISPFLRTFLPDVIASSIGASAGSFLFTCAISLHYFGTTAPFGIIAAVFVTPVAECFVTAGISGIILSIIVPFLLVPVGSILAVPYRLLQFLVQAFARLPVLTYSEDI